MTMPLEILIPMIVAGLALVGLLLRVLGLSKAVRLSGLGQAEAALLADHPDVAVEQAIVDGRGRAALLRLTGGGLALAVVFGDRLVTRVLREGDIAAVEGPDETTVLLRLNDFTLPRVRLAAGDREQAARAARWLRGGGDA